MTVLLRFRRQGLLIFCCILALSCGKEPSSQESVPSLSAPEPGIEVEVRLGNAVGPDGEVAINYVTRDFEVGEILHLSLNPSRTEAVEVSVRFTDAQGSILAQQNEVLQDAAIVSLQQPIAAHWQEGVYFAEIESSGGPLDRLEFNVVERVRGGREGEEEENYALIDVFYATDRELTASSEPENAFGAEPSAAEKLSLGRCQVSVPSDHRMGVIERPSLWRLETRPDPGRHISIVSLSSLPDSIYFRKLQDDVLQSQERQALVFIHGFNTSFTEAVLRTAQISYDLRFDGAPITYSWPSRGEMSKTQYHADEDAVQWTVPHLEQFLEDVAATSGAEQIHLVAHSMGNRALTYALSRIAARRDESQKPLFSEILLTAPDVSAKVFAQLAGEFHRTAERTTLYASAEDQALRFSKRIHGGIPRAGDTKDTIVVLPFIDTIDATLVDTSFIGHQYYGDNRSVLSDIFSLLRDHRAPKERFGLAPRMQGDLTYWAFER